MGRLSEVLQMTLNISPSLLRTSSDNENFKINHTLSLIIPFLRKCPKEIIQKWAKNKMMPLAILFIIVKLEIPQPPPV